MNTRSKQNLQQDNRLMLNLSQSGMNPMPMHDNFLSERKINNSILKFSNDNFMPVQRFGGLNNLSDIKPNNYNMNNSSIISRSFMG
jgi:hypothetical protein